MGLLGDLLDLLRPRPERPEEPPGEEALPDGSGHSGPYRAPAAPAPSIAPPSLDGIPRFAGHRVLATLDLDEGYARYLLQPPDAASPTLAAACFTVDPDADEGWFAIRFDEMRVLTCLAHENLARVLELGAHGRTWWHLSEYPRGETLEAVLAHHRYGGAPPGLDVVIAAFADFAEGLLAAHANTDEEGRELAICHGDLTPATLLLSDEGRGTIVDWGVHDLVCAYLSGENGLSGEVHADVLGRRRRERFGYVAPELMLGWPVTGRADVWALGVALHEVVTGRNLFVADTDVATVRRVTRYELPRPSTLVHGVPPELDALLERALAKDPAARIRAGELATGLRAVLAARGAGEGRALVGDYLRSLRQAGT